MTAMAKHELGGRDRMRFLVEQLLAASDEARTNLCPVGDRVLILPLDEPGISHTGRLYVVNAEEKQKSWRGLVAAVGPGTKRRDGTLVPLEVSVGDVVLFGRYVGEPLTRGGVDYRLVPAADILAVIVPPEDKDDGQKG